MDFEQFKEELKESVTEILHDRYGMDATVEARTMEKMNETYDALTVKPEDSQIGVNLNTNALYKEYEKGISFECIASKAAEIAENALNSRPVFDIDSFKDYSRMKETLTMEVVSAERNAELLQTVPHKNIEDMAVVYRFEITTNVEGRSSILVTNNMLEQYGITADQLHEDNVILSESEMLEKDYGPMFVNKRGMAMTYKNYKEAFDRFVNDHFRQALMNSEDPELRIYGQLLYENTLSPHALRHWFTVQLVLRGEDIGNLQFWRGDKSPQSAFTYLQNKGDLNRELSAASSRLVELLMNFMEENDDE